MSLTENTKKIADIVVFEGGEGVGKTTQIKLLHNLLTLNQITDFVFFREPGGTQEGERIRKLFVTEDLNLETITELLLITAARHENITKNILPSLQANKFVILDRFVLSTLIYQGKIYNTDIEKIKKLHAWFNDNLIPKLTIILNPQDIGVINQRLGNMDRKNNKIDEMGLEFHSKIYELYSKAEEFYEGKIEYIDANQNIIQVHQQIIAILQKNNIIKTSIKALNGQEIAKILKK